tara:strand:+ start:579 stop:701 length:123 start_codon:yes stop_codon:yes gene_type:complete
MFFDIALHVRPVIGLPEAVEHVVSALMACAVVHSGQQRRA